MNSILAVEIAAEQFAAARRLHSRLATWQLIDRALAVLAKRFPGFDAVECLLKTVTLNRLYYTNVYDVVGMARHVHNVVGKAELKDASIELVEGIAALPPSKDGHRRRRFTSFAAKFAHFFIDSERFPIYDSYAVQMLKYHLGEANYEKDDARPYQAFLSNLQRLRSAAGQDVSLRDLDHYLWLAGQYRAWRRDAETELNAEVAVMFSRPSPQDIVDLGMLTGSSTRVQKAAGRLE